MSNKMYDNITGRSPIATDDLGYIGTGQKASQILSGGTTDYDDLTNKPSINSVELSGNKTSSDLGLQPELTEAQTNAVNSGITAALTDQITTNQNNILSLLPTAYTAPYIVDAYANAITINWGGYAVMGNLCIINLRFTTTVDIPVSKQIFSGFPAPITTTGLSTGNVFCFLANTHGLNVAVVLNANGIGAVANNANSSTITAGTTVTMSGLYLCSVTNQ